MAGFQLVMRSGPTPGKVYPLKKEEMFRIPDGCMKGRRDFNGKQGIRPWHLPRPNTLSFQCYLHNASLMP